MRRKPDIEKLYGDNPVLDILHVAYNDYVQGRPTSLSKLLRLIYNEYSGYSQGYLKNLINITIHSEWFGKMNNQRKTEVHLIERGVEVYLNMKAGRQAEIANIKASWIIGLTVILTVLTIMLLAIEMMPAKD
jgi:hypothetical protein